MIFIWEASNYASLGVVTFHSFLVTSFRITRCSLQNLVVTRCRSCSLQISKYYSLLAAKFVRYLLQKLLVAKNQSLLVTKFARYSLQKLLVAKNHSLLVAEVARCKKSLDTRCKIRSLLVAKNHSLLVARCRGGVTLWKRNSTTGTFLWTFVKL